MLAPWGAQPIREASLHTHARKHTRGTSLQCLASAGIPPVAGKGPPALGVRIAWLG